MTPSSIKSAAAGPGPKAAALLMAACLFISCSGTRGGDRFRFVFMTDIHLEPKAAAVKGFESAIAQVNGLRPAPAFVITGGDLVADALGQKKSRADSLYDLYERESGLFKMPVHNSIGNHEYFGVLRESGVSTNDPEYAEAMFAKRLGGGRASSSFDHGRWHFILLDGISPTPDRNYIGKVDSSEIAWLKEDLSRVDSTKNVAVVTHIPLVTVSTQFREGTMKPNQSWLVVSNGDSILHMLAKTRLKLILQGHLHVLEEIRWRDTLIITGGAVSGAWWNGPFEGFEPGFTVLDVDGDDIRWRFEKLDAVSVQPR
jgi:3',5'-cyclic-AMP phosphodiesterase